MDISKLLFNPSDYKDKPLSMGCLNPIASKQDDGTFKFYPCRHCLACQLRKMFNLTSSAVYEILSSAGVWFVTLTYRNRDIPRAWFHFNSEKFQIDFCDDDGVILSSERYSKEFYKHLKKSRIIMPKDSLIISDLVKSRFSVARMLPSILREFVSPPRVKVLTRSSALSVTYSVVSMVKASPVLTFTYFYSLNRETNTIVLKKFLLKNGTSVMLMRVASQELERVICHRILLAYLISTTTMASLLQSNLLATPSASVLKVMRKCRREVKSLVSLKDSSTLLSMFSMVASSPLFRHIITKAPYSARLDVLTCLLIGFQSKVISHRLAQIKDMKD